VSGLLIGGLIGSNFFPNPTAVRPAGGTYYGRR
jgi:hypothetical protein